MRWILDDHLYPSIGPGLPSLAELDFDEIRSPQVLAVLRVIEQKGLHETAHRALTYASQIFNFGDACGFLTGKNPTASLRGVLAPVSVTHHASIYSPDGLGEFDVEAYRHAVDTVTLAQEIIVDNAAYPTEKIAKNSHDYRPLGLGYANLGALLMWMGIPYDSDQGRAWAAALTAR